MRIAPCTARARTKNIKRDPGTSGPHFTDTSINRIAALRDVTRTYMRCRAVSIGPKGSATLFGPSNLRNSTVLRANVSVSF